MTCKVSLRGPSVAVSDVWTFGARVDVVRRSELVGRGDRRFGGGLISVLVCLTLGLALGAPPSAQAYRISQFSATPSSTQAGGHPDLHINLVNEFHAEPPSVPDNGCGCNDAKDIDIHLPTGFIGNPHATPQCTAGDFARQTCPGDSQVGVIGISPIDLEGTILTGLGARIYNLVPKPGQAGLVGFQVPPFNAPVYIVLRSRTGSDYGLDAVVEGIEHLFPFGGLEITLWGVPAEARHDEQRGGRPSGSPEVPFLQNPTTCDTSLTSSVDILAYNEESASAESSWPTMTGCDQLGFNPSNFVLPTTEETDAPSGVALELNVPQNESPTVPADSEIRATTVTLPEGFVLSPNASDGQTFCSNTEAAFGTLNEAQCPEDSKVGTVEIDSPSLPGPLLGYMYIGEPQPGDRYRFVVAADGFNVHVKLQGSAFPNAQTGQQVVSFQNLPQFPFSAFKLHFFGSERGILQTPTRCGTYPVNTTFTPWDSELPEQQSTQYFTLTSGPGGSPCPGATRPFRPTFAAASVSNAAGAHSPFSVEIGRNDGDQNLTGLDVTTPPGLLASLKGVAYCPESGIAAASQVSQSGLAEAAFPSCPASSQIGTAVAGVGSGTHPVYFHGKVYLAGPYKGAPLSLVVITPGLSGPYDLGNVVVRAALKVNPETIQITAVSDPLPQILQGIPLRYRSVLIELNRPEFTVNPTNCDPFTVQSAISGDEGAQAQLQSHFQVANCSVLPFAPTLRLALTGSTKRAGTPALSATLTVPSGSSNIRRAQVTLPHSEFLDQAHIKTVCTRVQFGAGNTPGEKCPAGSIYGSARATSPLLGQPLEGPVYLRSSSHRLPDLVAALNGQITVDLDGRIDTGKGGGIRTTFEMVPDAPVSKFVLSLKGGKKGLLENSENLCAPAAKTSALVVLRGQNGKSHKITPAVTNSCSGDTKSPGGTRHDRSSH